MLCRVLPHTLLRVDIWGNGNNLEGGRANQWRHSHSMRRQIYLYTFWRAGHIHSATSYSRPIRSVKHVPVLFSYLGITQSLIKALKALIKAFRKGFHCLFRTAWVSDRRCYFIGNCVTVVPFLKNFLPEEKTAKTVSLSTQRLSELPKLSKTDSAHLNWGMTDE